MKHIGWLSALLGLLLAVEDMRAQNVVVVNPYVQFASSSFGFSGSEFGLSYRRRHLNLSIAAGGFNSYSTGVVAFSPYLTGPGYLTIVRGGAFGGIVVPPPFPEPPPPLVGAGLVGPANQDFETRVAEMLAKQRALLEPQAPKEGPIMVKVEKPDRPPVEDKPLPGQEAGQFRPIRPEDREKAKQPIKGDQPPPQVRKEEIKPWPGQNIDPKTAVGRFILLGREAFAQEGYGRAVQRFRQATEADGNNADAHLLLGQALFATGKYREAAAENERGLALDPNWPRQPFRPLDLYGPNVADYSLHIQALEDALALQPADPDLLFLLGYELWYDGRKEEAARLFRKAVRQAPNHPAIPLFLNQVPAPPVL